MATAQKGVDVTPHATNALPHGTANALHIGTAGTVVCRTHEADADCTFTVPAGGYVLSEVTHVRATSTATGIVALYL